VETSFDSYSLSVSAMTFLISVLHLIYFTTEFHYLNGLFHMILEHVEQMKKSELCMFITTIILRHVV
jgi:hypothetical protein